MWKRGASPFSHFSIILFHNSRLDSVLFIMKKSNFAT